MATFERVCDFIDVTDVDGDTEFDGNPDADATDKDGVTETDDTDASEEDAIVAAVDIVGCSPDQT